METPRTGSTSSWQRLKRGLWPEAVMTRLGDAFDALARELGQLEEVVATVVFGSYARGDYGRKSDIDLLVLVRLSRRRSLEDLGSLVVQVTVGVETRFHLPMHVVPLVADAASPDALGPILLHAIWSDGIILFAEAAALAALQPDGLTPWTVVRFFNKNVSASQAVRLSRRLHGRDGKVGILGPPAIELGRGALLVPANQAQAVRDVLDESGATYDMLQVWRAI